MARSSEGSFETIRGILLTGVHLCVPLPDRGFHAHTDMGKFGWGGTLFQVGDKGEKRVVIHHNDIWKPDEVWEPAVHKEGEAWCRFFERILPMVATYGQPVHLYTDSLPVAWMRYGSGRKAMSKFHLAKFDQVEWYVHYLPGPRNVLADALSRPPF